LGVNALYLNPVFDSPSLHKYGAARYWACFDFSDEE
jgi:glycosidase